MSIEATCRCESPEPALINHGLDSVCEKCGLLIAPLSADAQVAEARFQRKRGYLGSTPCGEIDDGP